MGTMASFGLIQNFGAIRFYRFDQWRHEATSQQRVMQLFRAAAAVYDDRL